MKRSIGWLAVFVLGLALLSVRRNLPGLSGSLLLGLVAVVGFVVFLSLLEDVITSAVARGIKQAREEERAGEKPALNASQGD
jgi:hypothetical protein